MSEGFVVSNSPVSSNTDIPVRGDADADGNVRQVFRLDVGTGTGESLLAPGNPLPTEDKKYAIRLDEVSSTISYVGESLPGTSTSAASWRVKKIDSTSGVIVTWADGNTNLDNIWDNRASLTYS
jgi:hypothetical protein